VCCLIARAAHVFAGLGGSVHEVAICIFGGVRVV
jgi:hypothetical protein